jgi:acetyl-CoA carboxylase biotin carboxylase subunit
MLSKVFIANRGEIAVRVARACRSLGIPCVAAYSEADAGAEHVRAADGAVCVGGPEAVASYLDVAAIVAAAKGSGCDAIHPGYGFLAENGDLAEACDAAGLTFIGPRAQVLRLLGDKVQSRTTMQAAGVPVVPGTFEATDDLEALKAAATQVGVPLLVKATGGGGGTGMRRVDRDEDVPAALEEARAEAAAAFGNPALYVEKFVGGARHVEIQILADGQGTVVALGERECSVQRRHQKVIEESPSPAVDPALRERMCDAARKAAEAAGYVGAGTVEFLLGPDGNFYFLEVNARIQVEHPITEERFGVDLVAWQLRVAGGEALDPALAEIEPRGWAMEARLYAEDPATGFLPSAGRLTALELPAGPGIRVDAGVVPGSDVPMYYDPILAKIIAWGADREQCRRRLRDALAETVVLGVANNAAFLRQVLEHPAFVDGATHTRVLEETIVPELEDGAGGDGDLAAVAAAWALETLPAAGATASSGGGATAAAPGPWDLIKGRFPGGGE